MYNKIGKRTKQKAGKKAREAIAKGILIKPLVCPKCNKQKPLVAHHPNYRKPLEIIWACRKCHMQIHATSFERMDSFFEKLEKKIKLYNLKVS